MTESGITEVRIWMVSLNMFIQVPDDSRPPTSFSGVRRDNGVRRDSRVAGASENKQEKHILPAHCNF